MKQLILTALTIVSILSAKAEDYSKHYQNLPVELKQVVSFDIPDNTVSIADFGGVGDGVALNTEAFRKAISALTKKGGGRLVVPQGVWLTGPIVLKDNIDLHIERNAIVLFSPDKSLFVDAEGKSSRCDPGIKASKRKNIAITGEGIIDGNGAQWRPVKRSKVSDTEWKRFAAIGGVERQNGALWYPWDVKAGYKNIADTPENQEKSRQDLIRLTDCENILIEGVTVQNSPRFHVHPCNSKNIIIDGITVRCPWNAQNGDAIDLSDCHQALIVNSVVDAGDDGICMKSGKAKATALVNGCEDILIEDNTVFHAHGGFVIGSEDITGMKRIVVRRCRFSGTDTGLRFKSGIGRGGKTEDIHISDIVMNDITDEAIVFQCDYVDRPAGSEGKKAKTSGSEFVPEFTDIHISNVVCRGAKTAIKAKGIEGMNCIHDIEIANSTIVYTSKGADIDEATAKVKLSNVNIVEDKAQ
ncbi:MAG: glycoside hydrolase family 28 protein [Prevotellaceae bacterium]|nr:glycoside hydrolase family 28 protein [Prevotellaceae bacterium]MDD6781030.1 glycoside hydrolase family 28 protein [Prevotellaceae bacterium]